MPLLDYELFDPPLALDFPGMTGAQARGYFAWFVRQIPLRLAALRNGLDHNDGLGVPLDYSDDSFRLLGGWLDRHVEVQPKSPEKHEQELRKMPEWVHPYLSKRTLTPQTISVFIDCGIYSGETLRLRFPHTKWDYVRRPKRDADIHAPVLIIPGPDEHLNPVRILRVITFKVVDGISAAVELPDTLAVWQKIFEDSKKFIAE